MSSSEFNFIQIGNSNRSNDVLRAEWWRTVNAVGRCNILLRNVDGKYNGVFDIQDTITISVIPPDGVATTMFRGRVDGPGVKLIGQDLESPWEEYIMIQGVDRAQDYLFHNDFGKTYTDTTMQIKELLEDLFDVPKALSTNIFYNTPAGATPVIGQLAFRAGSSFLSTLQEAYNRAGWVSYVDDGLTLRAGSPGFSATAEIITNTGTGKNIIGTVEFIERDGSKIYNYIKLEGKNPMFDGYTENTSSLVTTFPPANKEDSTLRKLVGDYSIRVYNNNPVNTNLLVIFEPSSFDYTVFDLSKGEVGIWARYDNQAAGAGAPGVGAAASSMRLNCRLEDQNGAIADYYGEPSRLYIGDWGYCTFPLGEKYRTGVANLADTWCVNLANTEFDWENVVKITFSLPRPGLAGNQPSNLYLDGISLPLPVIAVEEDAASQTAYRRRPLSLSVPHIAHYKAMKSKAEQLLEYHKDSGIDYLKCMIEGNVNIQYAAQSVTVDIPGLNINDGIFYITELHHVCEPRKDVTNGYGFDYVTELELAPISGVAYDMSRLGDRQIYSPTQLSMTNGVGLGIK